jgi:hypothetical protein
MYVYDIYRYDFVVITNTVVDVYSNTFHSVGIQLAIFLMARSSWKEMWQAFQHVERKEKETDQKLAQVLLIGILKHC